jgi:hypothetical protein
MSVGNQFISSNRRGGHHDGCRDPRPHDVFEAAAAGLGTAHRKAHPGCLARVERFDLDRARAGGRYARRHDGQLEAGLDQPGGLGLLFQLGAGGLLHLAGDGRRGEGRQRSGKYRDNKNTNGAKNHCSKPWQSKNYSF